MIKVDVKVYNSCYGGRGLFSDPDPAITKEVENVPPLPSDIGDERYVRLLRHCLTKGIPINSRGVRLDCATLYVTNQTSPIPDNEWYKLKVSEYDGLETPYCYYDDAVRSKYIGCVCYDESIDSDTKIAKIKEILVCQPPEYKISSEPIE